MIFMLIYSMKFFTTVIAYKLFKCSAISSARLRLHSYTVTPFPNIVRSLSAFTRFNRNIAAPRSFDRRRYKLISDLTTPTSDRMTTASSLRYVFRRVLIKSNSRMPDVGICSQIPSCTFDVLSDDEPGGKFPSVAERLS